MTAALILPVQASASTRTALGWGIGSLAIAILYNATNLLLLRFFVDSVGLAAALASLLIVASKVYDAVFDPIMGAISDRTRSPLGRRRFWLLIGSVLCGLALPAVFAPPRLPEGLMAVWVGGALLFYATAYAVFAVPYMAMPAEMTDDPNRRSFIMAWRVRAIAIGQLAAGAAAPALVAYFGGGLAGHAAMAWLMGAVVFAAAITCFFMTSAATSPADPRPAPGWRAQVATLRNKAFVWLLIGKLFQLIGVAAASTTLAFFTLRVLKLPDTALAVIFLSMTIGIVVAASIWTRLSLRFGKQKTYAVGAAIYALANLSWLSALPGESVAMLAARGIVIGVGSAAMLLMGQSLLPDVMAEDRRRTGFAREGVFAGIYTTVEKLSFAVGIGLVGGFLQIFGYVPGGDGTVIQPLAALDAIRWSVSIFPALFAMAAALAINKVRFA